MKRVMAVLAAVASLAAVATAIATAAYPQRIYLPDGYRPEGIAAGKGKQLFVGSIPTGEVRTVDAKTGDVDPLVPARPGERAAIGLKHFKGRLFVAGGPRGAGYVYDARTGDDVKSFQFTAPAPGATFVNDVWVTRKAAYFTDSRRAVLYVVPADLSGFRELPVGVPVGEGNNLNGIVGTPNDKTLIAVRGGSYGELYRIDPGTGDSERIALEGSVVNGDGLLLAGKRTLYVVRNRDNLIAVVRLGKDLRSGRVVEQIPVKGGDVPTTIARLGSRLYLPSARFSTPPTENTRYWITRIKRKG